MDTSSSFIKTKDLRLKENLEYNEMLSGLKIPVPITLESNGKRMTAVNSL